LLPAKKFIQPAISIFGSIDIYGVVQGLSPIRKNLVMLQRSDLASFSQYIISLIAKEYKPLWLEGQRVSK
jgi:hypothetical protein